MKTYCLECKKKKILPYIIKMKTYRLSCKKYTGNFSPEK